MNFLVAFNGSQESHAALKLATDHAEKFAAKVIVVTSMGGGRSEKIDQIEKAGDLLAEVEKQLQEKQIDCETHQLARGLAPAEDIVRFAEENDIDQIYVGIKKRSRTQKIILGSNAQYVILKAPCPVVTVK